MNPIDVLRWTQEIRDLKARYFRLQDTKCWSDYAELFLDNSLFDVTEAFSDPDGAHGAHGAAGSRQAVAVSGPIVGRDAIVGYVSSGLDARVRSFHAGFTPEIEILSKTRARAVWPMEDWVWLPDGAIAQMHGWGHYHETYTRCDGRWHIQTLKITRIRLELEPTRPAVTA